MQKLLAALLATFTAHAVAAVATLAAPILAPYLHDIYGVEGRYVGLYSSIVYSGSLIAALLSVRLIKGVGAVNALKTVLVLSMIGAAVLLIRSPATLFLSAFIIGLSFGPMNPISSVILATVCPPRMRGRVFSIKQGAVPLGGGFAALIIPLLYAGFGINGVVVAIIAVCLAGLVMVMASLSLPREEGERQTRGWSLAVLLDEFRRTFAHREIRNIAMISTGLASVQFTFGPTLVYVLVSHGGFDAAYASWLLSVVMVASFLMRPIFGAFADWFGARVVIVGIAIVMIAFCVAYPFLVTGTFKPVVIAATIVYGTTCYSWNGVALSMLAGRAPRELIGEATAGTMAISLVGAVMAPVIFTALLGATSSLVPAYLSLAGFAGLALIFALSIEKK